LPPNGLIVVAFNGIGEDEHEPFLFPGAVADGYLWTLQPGPGKNACKTQWKPYDEVVTACLIAARHWFAEDVLEIHSDGDWVNAWRRGAQLYERVLGRAALNPLRGGPAVSAAAPLPWPRRSWWIAALLLLAAILVARALARR